MAGAQYIVDDTHIMRRLLKMRTFQKREALNEIGMISTESTRMRFDDSRAPDGTKWKRLSRETLLRRAGGRKKAYTKRGRLKKRAVRVMRRAKPLLDTGRLRNSITYQVIGDKKVAIGTNVEYAATHQFGRGRIPSRPFLGLSRNDRAEVHSILDRVLAEAMTR